MSSLGQNIKKAREAKGWTQEQLAHATGKNGKQVVSSWEKDKSKPSTKTLMLIAQVLETTVDSLTSGTVPYPYKIPDDKVLIAKEEYIEYLSWKNKKLTEENESLKRSSDSVPNN